MKKVKITILKTTLDKELAAEYGLVKATIPIVHAMDKWGADFFTRLGVHIPCDEE